MVSSQKEVPIIVNPLLDISVEEKGDKPTVHLRTVDISKPHHTRNYYFEVRFHFNVKLITFFSLPPTLPDLLNSIWEETGRDLYVKTILKQFKDYINKRPYEIIRQIMEYIRKITVSPTPKNSLFQPLGDEIGGMVSSILGLPRDLVGVNIVSIWQSSHPLLPTDFSFISSSPKTEIIVTSTNSLSVDISIPPMDRTGKLKVVKEVLKIFLRAGRNFLDHFQKVISHIINTIEKTVSSLHLIEEIYNPVEMKMRDFVERALRAYFTFAIDFNIPEDVIIEKGTYPIKEKVSNIIFNEYLPKLTMETEREVSLNKTSIIPFKVSQTRVTVMGDYLSFELPRESYEKFIAAVKGKPFGVQLLNYLTTFISLLPSHLVVSGDKERFLSSLFSVQQFVEEVTT